jgi:tetratricopeptide (TPR) repeat protein
MVILVGNLARTAKVLGHTDEAVAAYRRVAEVLGRWARNHPDLSAVANGAHGETAAAETVTAYQSLVAYLRELGRLDEAARVARQGRDWAAEVATDSRSFFDALARFHLEARAVAEARAKSAANASADMESASSAAVAALRNNVLAGWRDLAWLRTDLLPSPLRKRADYQDLIARVENLTQAEMAARNASSPAAEKVTARQKCLDTLEALAGRLPSARFIRRNLAQAKQELAQALLDAGRVEEARQAFGEALAVRERLVEEAPSSEQLRADLAQSQSATGDLFAAAGKLDDAARTWEKALATLEDALRKNPKSVPYQTALVEQLAHIGDQYGNVGLWDIAAQYHRRAFDIQASTDFNDWWRLANLLLETADTTGHRALTTRVVARSAAAQGVDLLHLGRILVMVPDGGTRFPKTLRQLAQKVNVDWTRDWPVWCRAMAAMRLGQAEKALPLLEKVRDPLQRLPAQALALHQLGRTVAAKEALQQADLAADQRLRAELLRETLKIPDSSWVDWLSFRTLRREAHQTIHGKPLPESPYDRLFHGRLFIAVDEQQKAEAEFAAAVAMRPKDADVWLTRSRIFANLRRRDRATADRTQARRLQAADPKAIAKARKVAPRDANEWTARGRAYAELGKWDEAAADLSKALDLRAEPKPDFPYYPWRGGRGEADELIAGSTELFERVTRARPKDATLSARRAEHFASTGRWAEAEAALRKHVGRFPDDWWAPCLLAKLLLFKGDVEQCRQVCRTALERFAGGTEYYLPINVGRAALLAPAGFHDHPLIRKLIVDADKQDRPEFWLQATAALAEYRRGDGAAALKRLEARVTPLSHVVNTQILADTIRALTYQKLARITDARAALSRARAGLDRHLPRPDRGWAHNWDWHNWIQVEVLVRQAESLIPAAPLAAARPGISGTPKENARRDRRARADQLSTQFALALVRVGVAPRAEVEAELRTLLARRGKVAAEEPANADYRSAVITSRILLGRFLARSGQIDKANKELTETLASSHKHAAENPNDPQARYDLAAAHRAVGDLAWDTDRPAEAVRSLRLSRDLLDAARKEDPKNTGLKKLLADVECQLEECYVHHGLLPEAAAVMRVEDWPETMNLWLQVRAGQLRLLAGDRISLRQVADRSLIRHGTDSGTPDGPHSKEWTLAAVALAHLLVPKSTDDADRLLNWAKKAADHAGASFPQGVAGAWEFRTGRYDEAIRRLAIPALREKVWAHAVIAMANDKLKQPDRARESLRRCSDLLAAHFRAGIATDGPKGDFNWDSLLDDLCFYQMAHVAVTGKPPPADPLQRLCRAIGFHWLGDGRKAQAEFKAAVEARPDDATLWLARSQAYTKLGRAIEAAADRARALQLAEKALSKRPEDSAAAEFLAGLLLEKVESKWKALKLLAVKSEGGATLTVQHDRSVLAGGANPDSDVYVVEAEVQGRIEAIRLETIPDPSMPLAGSGRADSGNFILTDFRMTAGESVVAWKQAYADFSQERTNDQIMAFPIAFAIDADESTGWAIWPRVAEPHWAVFVPRQPIATAGKTRLTIRLAFRSKLFRNHALGRFRLSATGDAGAIQQAARFAVASTPQAKLGAAYLALGDYRRAVDFLTKATAAKEKPLPAEWLVLAVAHAQMAEKDQARKACARAAELLKATEPQTTLQPLLRELLHALGTDSPEMKALIEAAGIKPSPGR